MFKPFFMDQSVIIVAGGIGTRIKSNVPKQFIEIFDKPILLYSIEKFKQFNPNILIVVVLSKSFIYKWQYYVESYDILKNVEITSGGETRFHSVLNGLQIIDDTGLVAIHDAARPLVSVNTIEKCFDIASKNGNAVPSIRVNDSLRISENSQNYSIDREKVRIIQTPQCFKTELIKKAYNQPYKSIFTDDASVFETIGEKINLVEGNIENFKITTLSDLELFKHYLQQEKL